MWDVFINNKNILHVLHDRSSNVKIYLLANAGEILIINCIETTTTDMPIYVTFMPIINCFLF